MDLDKTGHLGVIPTSHTVPKTKVFFRHSKNLSTGTPPLMRILGLSQVCVIGNSRYRRNFLVVLTIKWNYLSDFQSLLFELVFKVIIDFKTLNYRDTTRNIH